MARLRYDPNLDYYALLGVSSTASRAEIQHAFRQRAKDLHPDRNPDQQTWATEAFQRLNEAYKVLSDPALRRLYDDLRWPYQSHSEGNSRRWAESETSDDFGFDFARRQQAWHYSEWARSAPPPPPPASPPFKPSASPLEIWRALLNGPFGPIFVASLLAFSFFALTSFLLLGGGGRTLPAASRPTQPVYPTPTMALVTRPTRPPVTLPAPTCADPAVTITSPGEGEQVSPVFRVVGSATVADFWEYRVELAYLGRYSSDPTDVPRYVRREWTLLGEPSRASVTDGVLVETVNMNILEPGYYVLRLTVQQADGDFLPPCERLIVYRRGTR